MKGDQKPILDKDSTSSRYNLETFGVNDAEDDSQYLTEDILASLPDESTPVDSDVQSEFFNEMNDVIEQYNSPDPLSPEQRKELETKAGSNANLVGATKEEKKAHRLQVGKERVQQTFRQLATQEIFNSLNTGTPIDEQRRGEIANSVGGNEAYQALYNQVAKQLATQEIFNSLNTGTPIDEQRRGEIANSVGGNEAYQALYDQVVGEYEREQSETAQFEQAEEEILNSLNTGIPIDEQRRGKIANSVGGNEAYQALYQQIVLEYQESKQLMTSNGPRVQTIIRNSLQNSNPISQADQAALEELVGGKVNFETIVAKERTRQDNMIKARIKDHLRSPNLPLDSDQKNELTQLAGGDERYQQLYQQASQELAREAPVKNILLASMRDSRPIYEEEKEGLVEKVGGSIQYQILKLGAEAEYAQSLQLGEPSRTNQPVSVSEVEAYYGPTMSKIEKNLSNQLMRELDKQSHRIERRQNALEEGLTQETSQAANTRSKLVATMGAILILFAGIFGSGFLLAGFHGLLATPLLSGMAGSEAVQIAGISVAAISFVAALTVIIGGFIPQKTEKELSIEKISRNRPHSSASLTNNFPDSKQDLTDPLLAGEDQVQSADPVTRRKDDSDSKKLKEAQEVMRLQ